MKLCSKPGDILPNTSKDSTSSLFERIYTSETLAQWIGVHSPGLVQMVQRTQISTNLVKRLHSGSRGLATPMTEMRAMKEIKGIRISGYSRGKKVAQVGLKKFSSPWEFSRVVVPPRTCSFARRFGCQKQHIVFLMLNQGLSRSGVLNCGTHSLPQLLQMVFLVALLLLHSKRSQR